MSDTTRNQLRTGRPERLGPGEALGAAGSYPYTRGPYPSMYTGRLWTMRQYAGFGDAEATNARFRTLLEAGQTGLSVAFDLPTQMGLDSDDPMAAGEVGKVGRRDRLDRRHASFVRPDTPRRGHDVDDDQRHGGDPAAALPARRRGAGCRPDRVRGTVQNDILKEYIARGTYIYPVAPSMRLITDVFAYCAAELPQLEHDLDQRLSHP